VGLSGKESLPELWILARMNAAVRDIRNQIDGRDFMKAANSLYSFWYSELCDVYIENSKAIINSGSDVERDSALQTLYTVLETALLLSHPFLPFITEELWQRIPRRPGDETPSIIIAKYPEVNDSFDNPSAVAVYELVLGCSRGIRSLMSEYALKEEAEVFVQTFDEASHKTAQEQMQAIKSLSGKGVTKIHVLDAAAARPAGCVAFPVSSSAAVFLLVKGRIDMDAEIAKANTKLTKARANAAKIEKVLGDPAYQQKVAEATQEMDRKKLADLESEVKHLEQTVEQFKGLKLEN